MYSGSNAPTVGEGRACLIVVALAPSEGWNFFLTPPVVRSPPSFASVSTLVHTARAKKILDLAVHQF